MRSVIVGVMASALVAGCGIGVVHTPGMWDLLCERLPAYRDARAVGDDQAARESAVDVLQALPEPASMPADQSFEAALRSAVQRALDDEGFSELDNLAAGSCLDE